MLKRFFVTDTKPVNYAFLTSNLISSISHDGKLRFVKSLERFLLRGMLRLSPPESPVDMESVSLLEGKNFSRIVSVWVSKFQRDRKLAALLFKVNRIRMN